MPAMKRAAKRRIKRRSKGRMRNFLMFLPNLVRLCGSLLVDRRVPIAEKALFAGAIVYAISPIDLIPDILPFIGQVDDIYLIALTLLRLLNYTDERVIREHWRGGGDIVALSSSIASVAPSLLPQRVSRVLSSKVRLGSAGEIFDSVAKKKEMLVVEVTDEDRKLNIDSSSSMNN